ncbi:MAG: transcription antitermination factor NusB [Gammaproteobacteria bacterium]
MMAKSDRRLARRCAVQALYQWRITGQAPSQIRDSFIGNENLSGRHLEYFHELIADIPRRIERIDQLIAAHLDRAPEQVDLTEQAILRLGAYELAFAPDVPVKVALDEAVELARLFCAENGYKYVNAILDKIARDVRSEQL